MADKQFNFSRDKYSDFETLLTAPEDILNIIKGRVEKDLEDAKTELKKVSQSTGGKGKPWTDKLRNQLKDELDEIYKKPIQYRQAELTRLKNDQKYQPQGAQDYITAYQNLQTAQDQFEAGTITRIKKIREILTKNTRQQISGNAKKTLEFEQSIKAADEAYYNSQVDKIEQLKAERAALGNSTPEDKQRRAEISKEIKKARSERDKASLALQDDEAEIGKSLKNVDTGTFSQRRKRYQDKKGELKEASKELEAYKSAGGKDVDVLKGMQQRVDKIKSELISTRSDMNNANKTAHELAKAGVKLLSNLGDKVDTTVETFYSYQAKMEGLLQGTEKSYEDMMNDITKNIGLNPIIKQTDVMNNMRTLIESGITYNTELRAFLATLAEDIDATFNAFSEGLKTIIRVQQQDSTLERLGMETNLTQLYNTLFQDTTYLANNTNESIQSALTDALVGMSKNQSLEFEYVVQKWLGSLSSVGVGSNAVQKIAQGLNYLATGDVSSLSNDSALQTLFTMSANRAGLSYAGMLNNGLSSSETDDLLKAMVEYLQEIAESTNDNNVVQKQYANILGMSITDLTAITNLSTSTVNQLYRNNMTTSQMVAAYDSQVGQLGERVHISQKFNNILDNILSETAVTLATEVGGIGYMINRAATLFDQFTGGAFTIPTASVMGNFLKLGEGENLTYASLVKAGTTGLGLLGALMKAANNLNGGWKNRFSSSSIGGAKDLWGYESSITRGELADFSSGVSTGFSQSGEATTTTGSSSDTVNSTLSDAANSAQETTSITNQNVESDHTFDDFYKNVFDEDIPMAVKVLENDPVEKLYQALFIDKDTVAVEGITPKTSNANSIFSSVGLLGTLSSSVSNSAITETKEESRLSTAAKALEQAISSGMKSSSSEYGGVSVIELLQQIANHVSYTKSDVSDISSTVSSISRAVGS